MILAAISIELTCVEFDITYPVSSSVCNSVTPDLTSSYLSKFDTFTSNSLDLLYGRLRNILIRCEINGLTFDSRY